MQKVRIKSFTFVPRDVWAARSASATAFRVDGYETAMVPTIRALSDPDRLAKPDLVSDISRCEAIAVTGAYAKVGSPDVDSLVTIGEMRETLAFLLSPARAALRLSKRANAIERTLQRDKAGFDRRMSAYNRLPPEKRARTASPKMPKRDMRLGDFHVTDLAGLWLAFRYGIMPLIYESQDYWDAFNKAASTLERVTARDKFESSDEIVSVTDHGVLPFAGDRQVTTKTLSYKVSCRAGVLYKPRVETTQSKYGLEIHRFPSTLWELIPLSFVYDWLVNMSDVLDALTAELRCDKVLSAWVTTRVEWAYSAQRTMTPTEAGVGGTSVFSEGGTFVRRRAASLLDVSLRLRLEMNAKRVADAFALVAQFLKGK
jgi:hypothetical protein